MTAVAPAVPQRHSGVLWSLSQSPGHPDTCLQRSHSSPNAHPHWPCVPGPCEPAFPVFSFGGSLKMPFSLSWFPLGLYLTSQQIPSQNSPCLTTLDNLGHVELSAMVDVSCSLYGMCGGEHLKYGCGLKEFLIVLSLNPKSHQLVL